MGAFGRPPAFESVECLQAKIDEYFDSTETPTMSGMAVHLGVDRRTIVNYSAKEHFFPTIKAARARVEAFLEERLYQQNVAGVIFNLKNNFGWTDKTQQEISGPEGGAVKNDFTVKFVNVKD